LQGVPHTAWFVGALTTPLGVGIEIKLIEVVYEDVNYTELADSMFSSGSYEQGAKLQV
jgi:hypothetical protein